MIHLLITWSHTVFSPFNSCFSWYRGCSVTGSCSAILLFQLSHAAALCRSKRRAAWNGDNHFFLACSSEARIAGKSEHFTNISKVIFRASLWLKVLSHFRGMAETRAGLVSAAIYAWIWLPALPEVIQSHLSNPGWEIKHGYLLYEVSVCSLLQKSPEMQRALNICP